MLSTCPVCSYNESTIIGKPRKNSISDKFINKDYNIVQCDKCKAYYVSPEIDFTDEQWSMLYNSEYFSIQSNWLIRKRHKELNERFDKAEKLLSKKGNIRFLDIGAGEGNTLVNGVRRNWEVTGIDIVDNRIQEAKTSKINFIKGKFLEHHFPENHYDFIYLDSVLEHLLHPLEYLYKINRILKPGGILYIGVPNEDSLFNDIRKIVFNITGNKQTSVKIKPFDSPYHVVGFNSDSLKLIIAKAGLQIKHFRNFGRKFGFLGSPIKSRAFWIDLVFLFPAEIIGYIMKRDVYFEAYVSKKD